MDSQSVTAEQAVGAFPALSRAGAGSTTLIGRTILAPKGGRPVHLLDATIRSHAGRGESIYRPAGTQRGSHTLSTMTDSPSEPACA